jgi:hypothetical protein
MALLAVNIERLWDQVLQFIKEGRVIPVVSPELLTLEAGGRTAHLYGYLAERLAKQLRITSSSGDTLNTVVCRYLAEDGEIEDIYPALKRVMATVRRTISPRRWAYLRVGGGEAQEHDKRWYPSWKSGHEETHPCHASAI